MALEVVWTEEADEGVDLIAEYLQKHWSEKEIRKFFQRLEKCIEIIKSAPHLKKILLENLEQKNSNIPQEQLFFIRMIPGMSIF